ncbi:MAG: hypothetical protein HGB10_09010 [Coriobacteriia bacterium]|nr:hypothetical protein [Coriobacteriia bacterium]
MAYWLILGAMITTITGFLAIVLTNPQAAREKNPVARKAAVAMWLRILMAGWVFFVLMIFAVPGGLDGAWAWIGAQPIALQAAMWIFLLPWMLAVGAWQLPLPDVIKAASGLGVAVLTFMASMRLIDEDQAGK